MRTLCFILASTILAGCGGDGSPTSPGGNNSANVSVIVVFTPVAATYSAVLNNQTYTAAGGFTIALRPGTHEITGSFRGQAFGVGFGSIGGGGAESGSLRSIAGPSPQVTACSALYFNETTPTVQREFRLQFRVTGSVGSACQAG